MMSGQESTHVNVSTRGSTHRYLGYLLVASNLCDLQVPDCKSKSLVGMSQVRSKYGIWPSDDHG